MAMPSKCQGVQSKTEPRARDQAARIQDRVKSQVGCKGLEAKEELQVPNQVGREKPRNIQVSEVKERQKKQTPGAAVRLWK